MNNELSPEQLETIKAKIFAGHKIEAIKLYREFVNCELVEAKHKIESLEEQSRQAEPHKFTAPTAEKKGCLGMVAMVCGLAVVAGVCVWKFLF